MTLGGLIAVPTTGPWQASAPRVTLATPDQDGSHPSTVMRKARDPERTGLCAPREHAPEPSLGSDLPFFAAWVARTRAQKARMSVKIAPL